MGSARDLDGDKQINVGRFWSNHHPVYSHDESATSPGKDGQW